MSRPTHFLTAACILILKLPWPMRYTSWRMAQTSSTSEANPRGREQRVLLLLGQEPRAAAALMAGVRRDRLVLAPGFGFGKNHEENYPLLQRFAEFHDLCYPLMAGVSRKSFIGRALARDGKDAGIPDRLYGTLAAETAAILKGAHVIRTHDVKACADAVRIADIVVS